MNGSCGEMLAPCGIDCSVCNIYRAQSDPQILQRLLAWFRDERKKELKPEQIRCGGCLGDRAIHWSGDCAILKCAVDQHGLKSCSECGEFPCEKLTSWAGKGEKYANALQRLRVLREQRSQSAS
jgi:hypothetical protein